MQCFDTLTVVTLGPLSPNLPLAYNLFCSSKVRSPQIILMVMPYLSPISIAISVSSVNTGMTFGLRVAKFFFVLASNTQRLRGSAFFFEGKGLDFTRNRPNSFFRNLNTRDTGWLWLLVKPDSSTYLVIKKVYL